MKQLSVTFAVLLLSGVAVKADFKFGGTVYSLGWETKTNHAVIKEFFAPRETTNTWKTMITLQAHPKATKTKEVYVPYYDARKALIGMPPKFHRQKTNDDSDLIFELFIGAPGKTPHLEFALARFVETEAGVFVVAYSHKLPMSKKKNQKINVDAVVAHKEKWIQELLEMPIEAIKIKF